METVDILEVNPNYAHVRFNNGRETTVSLRRIAPLGDGMNSLDTEPDPMTGDPKELDSLTRLTLPPFYRVQLKILLLRIQFLLFFFLHSWMILRGPCQKTLTH